MKKFKSVRDRINQDGFDYTFMNYSDFEEIKDIEFHRLRMLYIESHKKLQNYINKKC